MGSRRSNPSVKPGQKNPIDSNTIRSSSLRDYTPRSVARCSRARRVSDISLQNPADFMTASEVFPGIALCFKFFDSSAHIHQLSAPNCMKFAIGRAVYSAAWVLNFIGHKFCPTGVYNTNSCAMGAIARADQLLDSTLLRHVSIYSPMLLRPRTLAAGFIAPC